MAAEKLDLTLPAFVAVGRDTRPSGPALSAALVGEWLW